MAIKTESLAIMFTDIVGYSALTMQDESLAMDILNKHDALIEPIIDRNGGKIIKHIGDAIFATFDEVDKCVASSIDIQSKLKRRNAVSKINEIVQIRIGIHYGKVIPKNNDLFGNDVNICSRIEGLSSPNCITTTEELVSELLFPDKVYSREIGYVKLKNINIPQNLYKIFLNKEDFASETEVQLIDSMQDNGCIFVDIENYEIDPAKSIMIDYINNIDGKENIEYIYIYW